MNRASRDLGANETGTYLHQTPWIASRDPRRVGRADVGELWREHRVRGIGLDEVVDAGAAAALVGIVERDELESRNCREDRQRRLRHTLRVLEMTRRVVSHANRKWPALTRPRGSEKLAHIPHPRADVRGSVAPFAVILQQV